MDPFVALVVGLLLGGVMFALMTLVGLAWHLATAGAQDMMDDEVDIHMEKVQG